MTVGPERTTRSGGEGTKMREPIVPQLSADEYLSWEARQSERFELHEGFVVGFAGGLAVHDRLAFNVRRLLEAGFDEPCRSFGSDLKIKASPRTFLYADAGVGCEESADDLRFVERPRVIVEVLSPSTRAYDLVEKRAVYRAMPSVEAYVIVHSTLRRLEIDERSGDTWTTQYVDGDEAFVLGVRLALDDVYARTTVI